MTLLTLFIVLPSCVITWMLCARWTRFKYGVVKKKDSVKKGFLDLFK